ncbi:hypothetical protein BO70DRAFT_379630 [Aspergillus heteromorphus CBS 117.55]|uniref:Uncharacterized protein n=1 Tax=Aspergillus heteromorphus CBS 117.55 TaxID=1448321 RepID=A0A317W9V5_9EURO|nr:uncharacterized protein BO70DRAFT_379630 [Aspergillus heteromorphus CBS 117.55]PWY82087.1 hypothetical protein BO70DRAFT_379630 [Aspergillus heteromorphus CBS 117.55]
MVGSESPGPFVEFDYLKIFLHHPSPSPSPGSHHLTFNPSKPSSSVNPLKLSTTTTTTTQNAPNIPLLHLPAARAPAPNLAPRPPLPHHALPPHLRTRLLDPRHLTPSDPDYDPSTPDSNLNFEFDHTRLPPMQVSLPLYFVNREAHDLTVSWLRKHPTIAVRFDPAAQCVFFTKPYDPRTDAMYVSLERWTEFICEPFDRQFEPDLLNRNLGCPAPEVRRIAVPRALLWVEKDPFAEFWHWFGGVSSVFLVEGEVAVEEKGGSGCRAGGRCRGGGCGVAVGL